MDKNVLEPDWSKQGKNKKKRIVFFAAACTCVIIIGVVIFAHIERKTSDPKGKTRDQINRVDYLPTGSAPNMESLGGLEIFPKIAVNGELYWWYYGENKWLSRHVFYKWKKPGVVSDLPEDCVYYGEIKHVPGNKPTDDCEMVSVFPATGQIYVFPDDSSVCFVVITALALDREIVPFYYENLWDISGDYFD